MSNTSEKKSNVSEMKLMGDKEFLEKLNMINKKAPDRIEEKLDKLGKELRKRARRKTPKKGGKLRKEYKLFPNKPLPGGGYEKEMTNTAPHFHLIEKGHRQITASGEEKGWTDGVFMVEKSMKEMEETMPRDLEVWLNELYKELM